MININEHLLTKKCSFFTKKISIQTSKNLVTLLIVQIMFEFIIFINSLKSINVLIRFLI